MTSKCYSKLASKVPVLALTIGTSWTISSAVLAQGGNFNDKRTFIAESNSEQAAIKECQGAFQYRPYLEKHLENAILDLHAFQSQAYLENYFKIETSESLRKQSEALSRFKKALAVADSCEASNLMEPAIPVLISILQYSSLEVNIHRDAAKSLSKIGSATIIPLSQLLDGNNMNAAYWAIEILADIKSTGSLEALSSSQRNLSKILKYAQEKGKLGSYHGQSFYRERTEIQVIPNERCSTPCIPQFPGGRVQVLVTEELARKPLFCKLERIFSGFNVCK